MHIYIYIYTNYYNANNMLSDYYTMMLTAKMPPQEAFWEIYVLSLSATKYHSNKTTLLYRQISLAMYICINMIISVSDKYLWRCIYVYIHINN